MMRKRDRLRGILVPTATVSRVPMQMPPATPGPPSMSTRLRLLGPVQLWAGDRQVDLGPARQRTVLAALAVDVGTPVSLDTLIGRVWDDDPPAGVRSGLYSYLTRIRRALAQVEPRPGLHLRSGGYVLEL